jgi:vacuolar-type H+-ATPase subunit F/Vma7
MASRVTFIGDEVTAAGFRLAGVSVRVPARGAETVALREEVSRAALILIGRGVAGRVDPRELQLALASASPLVLVLPDAAGLPPEVDVAARVRLQLGVDEA